MRTESSTESIIQLRVQFAKVCLVLRLRKKTCYMRLFDEIGGVVCQEKIFDWGCSVVFAVPTVGFIVDRISPVWSTKTNTFDFVKS